MDYECVVCHTEYPDDTEMICQAPGCGGGGLTGIIVKKTSPPPPPPPAPESGLCVLLMDASGSMVEPAYPDHQVHSKYNPGQPMSKREAIADIAAQAIFDLKNMSKSNNAFIRAIKFDASPIEMFTYSIAEICESKFKDAKDLARYFYDQLSQKKGQTNVSKALDMAFQSVHQFIDRRLPGAENHNPLWHMVVVDHSHEGILVPNIRVLLYTDGEQTSAFGPITNPFHDMELKDPDQPGDLMSIPNLLMGAFIGQRQAAGYEQLRQVIGKCPIHNQDSFFVLDSVHAISSLQGLFRMASGTSGFCPECLGNERAYD